MTTDYTNRFQGTSTSVAIKAPVRFATTAHIAHSGFPSIDGGTPSAGQRVLDKDNNNPVLRGIWIAQSGDWYRALDFNGDRDVAKGTQVYVTNGDSNGGSTFVLTTNNPVIGTSGLTFGSLYGGTATSIAPFRTVADMVASLAPVDGDYVETQGYWEAGDGGAGLYRITDTYSGTPDEFADHALDNGLFAVLRNVDNTFVCEQYGASPDLADSSDRIAATIADALIRNDGGDVSTKVVLSSTVNIKNQIYIGADDCSNFDIDFSAATFEVVAGGDITAENSAIYVRAGNSTTLLGRVNCNKLGAGFTYESCTGNSLRKGFADRYIGWGHKLTGQPGGGSLIDAGGREWRLTDDEFNDQSNFEGNTLIVDCADSIVTRAILGWGLRNVYITNNASNTLFDTCHFFQGSGNDGEPIPEDSICVESDAKNRIILDNCYFDNGYVYDNTNRVDIFGGRYVVLPGKVTLTRPWIRIVPLEVDSDQRSLILGINATVGYYETDHVTPDAAYTWLAANPLDVVRPGTFLSASALRTHISTSDPAGTDSDELFIKRGVAAWEQKYVTKQAATDADDVIVVQHGNGVSRFSAGLVSLGLQGMGYGDGAGDIETQLTDKATGVTLDNPCGRIVMHNASLSSGASVSFELTCAALDGSDLIDVQLAWTTLDYSVRAVNKGGGVAIIQLKNETGGSLAQAVTLNYAVKKATNT